LAPARWRSGWLPRPVYRVAALLVALCCAGGFSFAGTTWTGGGIDTSWGTAGNWGGALPLFNGTEAITIANSFTSGTTLSLNGSRYIDSLTINAYTAFTIAAGTGGTVNLRSGNITRLDVSGKTEATQTISSGIVLGDPSGVAAYSGTWNIAGSNGLIVSGNITEAGGSRGVNIVGGSSTNWVQLSGTNTFTGGLTATAGTIFVSADANMGASSGGLTMNGGILEFQGSFTSGRAIKFTGSGGLYVDSGSTVEMTGVISGNGNLVANDGTANAGTLILSGSGSNGTGYTQVWNNSVFSLRGTVALGSGILQLVSGGILELGNSNFTRSLGTAAGQVNMGVTTGGAGFAAWGADRIVNLGGSAATVTWNSGSFVLSGSSFYLGSSTSNATLDFQNGIDLAGAARTFTLTKGTGTGPEGKLSGIISGSAAASAVVVTSANDGRLLLSNGSNSYAGSTTVNSGALWLGANATSGAGNTVLGSSSSAVVVGNTTGALNAGLETDAAVTIGRNINVTTGNTGTTTVGGVSADNSTFTGNITLGSTTTAGHNLSLAAAAGGSVTLSGTISDFAGITGAKGSLTKTDLGTVVLKGANTYAGAMTVSAGALNIQNATALGGIAAGTTVSSGAALQIQGGTTVGAEALGINGGGVANDGALRNISGSNSYAGAITLQSASTIASDAGTLTLSNTVANGGFTSTFGGAGNVTANGVISGSGALVKNGSGTLTLAGSNTFSGGATLNGGTTVTYASGLGASSGAVNINAATLEVAATTTTSRNFVLGSSASAFVVDPSLTFTVGGVISGAGNLCSSGTGTLTLTGANTYTGMTNLTAGTLNIQNSSALGTSGVGAGTAISSGAALQYQGGITVADSLALSGTGVGGTGALVSVNGTNTHTGAITLAGSALIAANAGKLIISAGIDDAGAGKQVNFGGGGDIAVSGVVSGTTAVVKDGSGTLALSGANTYGGGTTLNAGTLSISDDSGLGGIGSSLLINAGTLEVAGSFSTSRAISLGNSASTIQTDPSSNYSITSALAGSGALTKTGTGTLLLTGTNTYSGGTTINAGTVVVNSASSLGALSGSLNLNAGVLDIASGFTTSRTVNVGSSTSTFQVDPGQIYTNSAGIAGSGGLTKNGAGKMVIGGNSTFTGATTVNAGTLVAAAPSGSALGLTVSVTINSGGQIQLGASNQINNAASVTLAGGTLSKGDFSEGAANAPGMGSLILTAPNSTVDFGTGTTGTLEFVIFTPGTNTLLVDNWTGVPNAAGDASTDRLIFASDQSANLTSFNFLGYWGATEIPLPNGYYEVTPMSAVPEMNPAQCAALTCVLAGLLCQRRRLMRLLKRPKR
jgi:fibronectin-binding autotransporter adhesin